MKQLPTKVSSLQASLTRQESNLRKKYRETESKRNRTPGDIISSGDDEDATCPHRVPLNDRITQISIKILSIVKKLYPRMKDNNLALLLLDSLCDG